MSTIRQKRDYHTFQLPSLVINWGYGPLVRESYIPLFSAEGTLKEGWLRSRRGVFNPPPRGGHRGCFLLWSGSVFASTLDTGISRFLISLNTIHLLLSNSQRTRCPQSDRRGIITLFNSPTQSIDIPCSI